MSPFRYHLYDKEPCSKKGFRVMSIGNYFVFYLPVEFRKTVVVIRIMYGGRDIETQLRLTKED